MRKKVFDRERGVEHLLEVVEDEKERAVAKVSLQALED
jgi:hypothetical protein